ncbi:MAG: PDZ domain-containing protein [Planctomycetota bacterium]
MAVTGERATAVGLLLVVLGFPLSSASATGNEPASSSPAFEPGAISIGEPIAVPFAKPGDRPRPETPASVPTSVLAPAAAAAGVGTSPAPVTGMPNGWLGLAVSESRVPGRWSIVEVAPAGPAAAAGIAIGDDLASIDGVSMRSADEVAQALTAIAAGQNVRLSIARGDQVFERAVVAVPRPTAAAREPGREWQPSVPTATAAAPARSLPAAIAAPSLPAAVPPGPRGRVALGVRTIPIDPETRERFRLRDEAGAYVIGVVGDLPASRAGIPPGSVIVKMNEQPVRSPEELTRLVTAGPVDRPVPVEFVLPGGTGHRADVTLQSLEKPLERALVGETSPQPTAVPTLGSGPLPRTSRMPVTPAGEVDDLRREVGRLRGLLEAVERRLERLAR